jgi:hippurate hydrolase
VFVTTPSLSLLDEARGLLPEIVAVRRRLHRRPEVGLRLPESQAIVVEELALLGLTPTLGRETTSAAAIIEGSAPGPTILLRADMDALPLMEETGLEFGSEVAGVMHACGHDMHMAMLLGAARVLSARRSEFAGRIVLMFQPGEEGHHGARIMIDEGLLELTGEDSSTGAFALHISTLYPSGTINIRPGPLLAAADILRIAVRGRGGHASTPHLSLDPIPAAAALVGALEVMVTRRIDVFDPAVVTIARFTAGTTNNIIPETAELEGTIRTFSAATRTLVHDELRAVAQGIAAAHGAEIVVDIVGGYPVTVNDDSMVGLVSSTAADLLGADAVSEMPAPLMAAEDFSYVLQRLPGAMAFLGARPPGLDPLTAPQNHSNRVVFDESALAVGAATYAAVALRYLATT